MPPGGTARPAHGGHRDVRARGGITIMTSVETVMATAESQPVRRVSSGEPGRFTQVGLVASTPSLSLTTSPVYWS